MKSDFLIAVTQLSAEKHLPKEVVLGAVEAALVSAYRREGSVSNQNISVKISPNTGEVRVFAPMDVVEEVADPKQELSLAEAQKLNKAAKLGDTLNVEVTPHNAGRIAAQIAKQVVLQRLREAEHEAIFEEYATKAADIVSGVIRRVEPKHVYIDLGRAEGVLPAAEQTPTEHYRVGQRLKVYMLEVERTPKGPQILVSRSHRNLLRRLMELEIPEIHNGTVEIKSIAREAGYRSKVAVAARQAGVDPVGCCVGLRGIRIQNVVNELNGERIDVIQWHPDPAAFIANALSPAPVVQVVINEAQKTATVIVPDKQLSLAIGKEGQNARLVAKLTGWGIDIKSASTAEAEKAATAEITPATPEVISEAEAVVETMAPQEVAKEAEVAVVKEEKAEEIAAEIVIPELPEVEITEAVPAKEAEEPEAVPIEVAFAEGMTFEPEPVAETPQLRFAEDVMPRSAKTESKGKKKGKEKRGESDETSRARGTRRGDRVPSAADYDEEY